MIVVVRHETKHRRTLRDLAAAPAKIAIVLVLLAICCIATSAIDVSDGLLGDLGHILRRSGVAAEVSVDAVPRSAVLAAQPLALQRECTLAGGDDYELLFSAPAERAPQVQAAAQAAGTAVTRIGRIEAGQGLRLVDGDGHAVAHTFGSFDHFRS